MLKSLHIENIAVIEKTDIDFSEGLSVLTGETGAGKSIVIDSINAVLGERTSRELIRNGCDKALVTALFTDISGETKAMLTESGYEPEEDGTVLIMRSLSISGNGIVRINDKPATASVLRSFAKTLVNIHGQHDSQNLLDPQNHILYLDRIAANQKLLEDYYSEFKHLNGVRRELSAIETDTDEKNRRTELLEFQIDELVSAKIKVGELETLKKQLEIAENYGKMMVSLNKAYELLNGTEDSDGAVSMIKNAQGEVISANVTSFENTTRKLSDILVYLEDVCTDIRSFEQNSDLSSLDSSDISSRIDIIYKLMSKYGNSEQQMLDYLLNAQNELENIVLSDKREAELSEELDKSTERLVELGDKLTKTRTCAAEKFSHDVTDALCFLDMPDVAFSVNIKKGRYTRRGCDEVEFMIRTNAGETSKSLQKIASGGELSRVMLAIKSILADKDDVDTLIFDEIDTGISGRAAGKVGIQLKKLSKYRQVVCVTHLAQICAFADNHLLIEKSVKDNRTYTQVSPLSYDERIKEIARIMSGTELTDNLFNSAKELLDRSIKYADL